MSDLITPETLNEHQEIIEYNQQEFKDNFKYKLFKNALNELYLVFDYIPGGLETDTKIETVFEYLNTDMILLKTNTFVFEQIKEMTMFENEIISYLNNYTDEIPKISILNYSEDLEYLIDYSLFKKISDSTKNIEMDLKQCSIDLESNGSVSFDSFTMISGHFLVDKSFLLQSNNIVINQIYINSYNDKYADSIFNIYTEKSVSITNIQLYAATKLNIICDNKDGDSYMNNNLNINYFNVYGKELVDNDLNVSRLTIKGFYKCYIDVMEIEDDVSYGTILSLDLLDYVFIGNISRNIKTIRNGDTIIVNSVAKLIIGEAHISIIEESDISQDTSFIKYNGTEEADKKILLNNINIQNDSETLFTFFKIAGDSITKFTASNITISKNVLLFDTVKNDSTILKANISFLTITGGDTLEIKNCDMLTISNCIVSLDNIYLLTRQINVINCEFKSKLLVLQNKYMTKCTTNKSIFTSDNIIIKNDKTDVQPKAYLKNSRFFVNEEFIIENIIPSITNTFLNISSLSVYNDSFVKCNEVIIQPRITDIIFNIETSIIGYFVLSVVNNYHLEFNVKDSNKSFIRNIIEMSSNSVDTIGKMININTNYPISTSFEKCNTSIINILLSETDELSNIESVFKTTLPNQKYILESNKKYDLITVDSEEGSDYITYNTKNK